ncbi:MAG: O-antigen ligase family protein [Planctomycetia bacterium]|nr:O-antigen ligase family protein [Planctomycetia bacterium]
MTFVVAILTVAAAFCAAAYLARGSTLLGCLAFLLMACCFGHPLLSFDLGPVPLTLDRLLLLLVIAAAAVQWHRGRMAPKPLAWVDKLLFVFVVVLGVSTFSGDWRTTLPGQVLTGQVPPAVRLVLGYLMPVCVYFVARQSAIVARNTAILLWGLTLFGVYLAVTGILEVHEQWSFVFPAYIANPDLGIHFGRARGPMLMSVTFGLYLTACLAATWVLLPRLPRFWQLLVAPLTLLLAAGIYYSYTRSVWLGAALAGVVVLALLLRGNWRRIAVLGVVVAGVVVAAVKFEAILNFQREGSIVDTRQSADMRKSFAYVSWEMFLDKPIFGFGFGQFPLAKMPYLSDRSSELNLESIRHYVHHNTYFSLQTETGIVGLGLFLAILAGWGRSAWVIARRADLPPWVRGQGVLFLAVLATYACQLGGHELSYDTMDNSLVFLLAGMAVGLRQQFAPANSRGAAAATSPSDAAASLTAGAAV